VHPKELRTHQFPECFIRKYKKIAYCTFRPQKSQVLVANYLPFSHKHQLMYYMSRCWGGYPRAISASSDYLLKVIGVQAGHDENRVGLDVGRQPGYFIRSSNENARWSGCPAVRGTRAVDSRLGHIPVEHGLKSSAFLRLLALAEHGDELDRCLRGSVPHLVPH
jgi:hypothetical protein